MISSIKSCSAPSISILIISGFTLFTISVKLTLSTTSYCLNLLVLLIIDVEEWLLFALDLKIWRVSSVDPETAAWITSTLSTSLKLWLTFS